MTSGNNDLQSQEAYPHLDPLVGLFHVIDISRNPITKELYDFSNSLSICSGVVKNCLMAVMGMKL